MSAYLLSYLRGRSRRVQEKEKGEQPIVVWSLRHLKKLVDIVWDKTSYWYARDWNEGNDITFDEEASGFARVIVKVCGEDPDKVTSDQMKEIDARVERMLEMHQTRK